MVDVTYKQLKRKFKKDVEKLQRDCPHKSTKWYDEYWAPGHSSEKRSKFCL